MWNILVCWGESMIYDLNQTDSASSEFQVYWKAHGSIIDFKMHVEAILLSLTRKVWLPDFEFLLNVGDWPLEKRRVSQKPAPVFSWCGSEDTRDIIMPTYDVTGSTLGMLDR